MMNWRLCIFSALTIIVPILPLFAGESFRIGSMGLPMVSVTIGDSTGKMTPLWFLLDTGSNISILDNKIAKKMKIQNINAVKLRAAEGDLVSANEIIIPTIAFGSYRFNEIKALNADLANTVGLSEDGPFDGILGMDLLDGLIFEIDSERQIINWKPVMVDCYKIIKLTRSDKNQPQIEATANGQKIIFICDTGSNDFLTISTSEFKSSQSVLDSSSNSIVSGLEWKAKTVTDYEGKNIEIKIDNQKWCKPTIEFSNENTSRLGKVGLGTRTLFDFNNNNIGLITSTDGCLSIVPIIRCPIACHWTIHQGRRRLTIVGVKPGSVYEAKGLLSGDIITSVDDANEQNLTIVELRRRINLGSVKKINIERNKKAIAVIF